MRRFYRDEHRGRFRGFEAAVGETDLWIGVDRYSGGMEQAVHDFVTSLRRELEEYISENPVFLTSLEPVTCPGAPESVSRMACAALLAGVGPMAAVAGAFAQMVGETLEERFRCREVVVENGGDIYLLNAFPVTVSVFAGGSPLSNRTGLEIPAGRWGICTSSATVGHSLSFGKADAVTIVSDDAAVADAFATACCNRIRQASDLERTVGAAVNGRVRTALAILGDRMAVAGEHPLAILPPKEDPWAENPW